MSDEPAVRNRETEQEGTDDPDSLLFPDDSEKDRIVEYSPQERFYRFNEEIGFGSYKSVFRGHDSDTGREIAWNVIKLMRLPPQERKRLTEEIYILRNISHKKIISFINAWLNKNKNEMIFITEMVSGGSLKKHLRKIKKPRLKIIKGWCREILEGLNYLHSQKPSPIIHRDIKCENIFINTNTNEIRIGDLGLAIFTRDSYAETLIGTPEFMAPEIFEGKYSTGVDIYAFGMCVLEMATLETPYQECKGLPQIYKHIEQRIKPKSLELIECDSLRNFISKCLNDSKDRPSAAELLEDEFFQPDEDDKKEVQLRPNHSVIQEVSPELESTLKKEEYFQHSLTPMEHVEEDIQEVMMRHSRNPAGHSQSHHPLASSADIGKIIDVPLQRMHSNEPVVERSIGPESPSSIALQRVKSLIYAEFKEMYDAYRQRIMPHVREVDFVDGLNAFEWTVLRELHESGSSPAANVSLKQKSIAANGQKIVEKTEEDRKLIMRQNSSDKLDKRVANELETKSMMEVNEAGRKTPGTAYNWADSDFDFISPQNQPSNKQAYAYSAYQNKHGSSKNINIPASTPPTATKNATKLAEIANKIKVELPKPNTQPSNEEEGKNKSEEVIKQPEVFKATSDIGKYKQQLFEGAATTAGSGIGTYAPQPFDLQRQLAEKAKKEKSSPKSTEPSNPAQSKPILSQPEVRRNPSPYVESQNFGESRKSLPIDKDGQPDINLDKKNILSALTKAKSIPPAQSSQANPPATGANIRNPNAYIVPGTLSSAPTSPTPPIQQIIMSTTPTSPPPIFQQSGWNMQAMYLQQQPSPITIPTVQPFGQPPYSAVALGSPNHVDPQTQTQTQGTHVEKSESLKTAPALAEPIDLLSGVHTPKDETADKSAKLHYLHRSRTEQYTPETILLSQARKKQKQGIKFPISKQGSSKEDVMMLQNILSRLMDEKLEAIGVFGHYTQELVKRFQQNHKLRMDGTVDQNMYMLMLEQLQKSSKQTDKQRQLSEKEQRQRQQTNELSRKLMSQMEQEVLKKQ